LEEYLLEKPGRRKEIVHNQKDRSIHIKSYDDNDRQEWNNFVLDCKSSTFFHMLEWKNIIEDNIGHKAHYMMALQGDKITGILPLFETKNRLFGHSLVSMPCVVYGGVCAVNKEAEKALYQSAATLGEIMGVDYIEMKNQFSPLSQFSCLSNVGSNPPRMMAVQDRVNMQDWITKDLYATFEREIYPDTDANFIAIPRKQRRMIRKGINNGLISKIGRMEHIDTFYDLFSRNLQNHGTPVFSLKYLKSIIDTFPKAFILSVWKDRKIVAAVMTFVFKERLIPYYSGALKEYNQLAVNDFMYWDLMRYGSDNGYKLFDFGRSKRNTGSYDFKRHWGFNPETLPFLYYLVTKNKMPEVNPSNPRYSLIINTWKRLPLSFTKWLGPKINRMIP
jgi:FemAB-related protein (PEP-CTERM system-associated)